MLKEDNKSKMIMDHKEFVNEHKWFMHMYTMFDMLNVFVRLSLCLLGESSSDMFHTVGKKPAV